MADNFLISLMPLTPGLRLVFLALFWASVFAFIYVIQKIIKSWRGQSFTAYPLLDIGSMGEGGRQFITGQAHSPVQLVAPVSRAACVFYLEKVRMAMEPGFITRRGRNPEADLPPNAYGIFFITDGSKTALVAPDPKSVDLTKPESKSSGIPPFGGEAGDANRAERLITENEAVTVLGTPGEFSEFMRYLRANAQGNMPPEMIKELVKMEGDPGRAGMPCYFDSGVDLVTDQSYNDYIARNAAAVAAPVQTAYIVSAGLLAGVAGLLWYALMLGSAAK